MKKGLEKRISEAEQNDRVYWETAEQLAYATILEDKHPIRLSGQDARRGTFSHRHAAVYDAKNGRRYVPLSEVAAASGTRFEVWDSPLSEAGRARVRVRLQASTRPRGSSSGRRSSATSPTAAR